MVGLTNPDGVSCSDGDCDGKLKWEDGTNFNWNTSPIQNIKGYSGSPRFAFKLSSRELLGRKTSTAQAAFACMSSCKGKAVG